MELKLKDEWEDKCVPSGGTTFRKDEIGRRTGHGNSLLLIERFYLNAFYSFYLIHPFVLVG